jgi:hypothetical protein
MGDSDKAGRYRDAAEAALAQLDWCINYLRDMRKKDISRMLSRNRDSIRRRLHERPASKTDTEP